MYSMEFSLVVCAIAQSLTAIVIAVATVHYARTTSLLLSTQIDPKLGIKFYKVSDGHGLSVRNESGCLISGLGLWFTSSVPVEDGSEIGKSIYANDELGNLKPEKSLDIGFLFSEDTIRVEMEKIGPMPEGIAVTLVIEYAFIRHADKQRYCYRQPVSIVRKESGELIPFCVEEPQRIPSVEKLILAPKNHLS